MKAQTRLKRLFLRENNCAYSALRLAKEGILPQENPRVKQALDAIELAIFDHFGELNALQQVHFALMRPLFVFFILHPGINPEDGKRVNHDFQWIFSKIEVGLKNLITLGESAGGKAEEYDISKYLVNVTKNEGKKEKRKKPSWTFK